MEEKKIVEYFGNLSKDKGTIPSYCDGTKTFCAECIFHETDKLQTQGKGGMTVYMKDNLIIKLVHNDNIKEKNMNDIMMSYIISKVFTDKIPNFVTVRGVEVYTHHKTVCTCIVMEYCDKNNAEKYLTSMKSDGHILDILYLNFLQLVLSLTIAEQYAFRHGDLFLDNVFVKSTDKKWIHYKIANEHFWIPIINNIIFKIGDYDSSCFLIPKHKQVKKDIFKLYNLDASGHHRDNKNLLQLSIAFNSFINTHGVKASKHKALTKLLSLACGNNQSVLKLIGDSSKMKKLYFSKKLKSEEAWAYGYMMKDNSDSDSDSDSDSKVKSIRESDNIQAQNCVSQFKKSGFMNGFMKQPEDANKDNTYNF